MGTVAGECSSCQSPSLGFYDSLKNRTILNNNTPEEEMLLKIYLNSQEEYNQWKYCYDNYTDLSYVNVLLLPKRFNCTEEVLRISQKFKVTLAYEPYLYSLATEINARRQRQIYYLQTEIWYLLYKLVEAGTLFEKLNQRISNVHPRNVLINRNGRCRLLAKCSGPQILNNIDTFCLQDSNFSFLSPQQLVVIPQQTHELNFPLCESFSVGMTVLSACTLDNLKMAYQPCENGWRINKMQLHIYVNQLKKQYSSELSHVVTGLLQIPLNSRDKCSQIYCWLAGYEKKILSLETFLPVMKVKKTLVEIEPDKIKENRVNLSVDNRGKGDVRSNNGDFFDNENDDFPTVEKKKMRGTFCHGKY